MREFAKAHEKTLKKYLALKNGIPSHDTIRRVMGMTSPESFKNSKLNGMSYLAEMKGKNRTQYHYYTK